MRPLSRAELTGGADRGLRGHVGARSLHPAWARGVQSRGSVDLVDGQFVDLGDGPMSPSP
jgi:hypothetical protein